MLLSGQSILMTQLEKSTGKYKGSTQPKMAFDLCYIFISFSSVSGKILQSAYTVAAKGIDSFKNLLLMNYGILSKFPKLVLSSRGSIFFGSA